MIKDWKERSVELTHFGGKGDLGNKHFRELYTFR